MTNRKEYMRLYMRKYRQAKQGMTPTRINHTACDRSIEELSARVKELESENRKLREMLPF